MSLKNIGFLAVHSNRSKIYLQMMCERNLAPSYTIIMHEKENRTFEEKFLTDKRSKHKGYDLNESLETTLKKYNLSCETVSAKDPNDHKVVTAVAHSEPQIIVYSGPGGVILKNEILGTGKNLLHIHSGVVPQYRGSTTSYYSLINEGTCGASAFFMNNNIDDGPLIRTRTFPPPEDRTNIDVFYDSYIRATLLCDILNEFERTGQMETKPQSGENAETYFIIHPVLKHVAILGQ